ncbi:ABC transporter substrate-binding protein [Tenacibaculum sp. SZ-18]|uniref:ABC transporter substrate-binding protein n=1 Tax=Tenacibaculum sp. SZ-18 TaxID=754423 RepID=UPI000C2D496D|nr:ABC transporter substrate-binding protein [Tenacibaculum sp. SZ-18]AUC15202.1 ABC transporter substrate-binding protein [Tenacibaculum sp. SZ-18]
MNTTYIFNILFCLILFYSCKNKAPKDKTEDKEVNVKYANGFDIVYENGNKYLILKRVFQSGTQSFKYLLTDEINIQKNAIKVPVEKLVVTSTTHIPMVELLEKENNIIGFPNTKYISSEKTRTLVDSGAIKELGSEQNMNTEVLIDLEPELVIGFALHPNDKLYNNIKKLGIPVLFNGDWLEETPLGRAEWIKVFGVLLDKEKQADSIFSAIERNYNSIKALAQTNNTAPKVLSGSMYKDTFYVPAGESFMAKYMSDANLDYIWKDTKGTGSLQLNFESVLDKAQKADFWLGCGLSETRKELMNSNRHYNKFDAFTKQKIYTVASKKGPTGGLIYFELAPTRPDLVLKDMIKITSPELLPDYEFTFFELLK